MQSIKNFFLLAVVLLCCSSVYSRNIVLDVEQKEMEPRWLVLPYFFHTETLDTAYGIGGGTSGYLQPQMGSFITVLGSTNDTKAVFWAVKEYQLPLQKRLFIDFVGSAGDWTDQRTYGGFNPDFGGERAGSNDSHDDNFVQGSGHDGWFDLTFRYVFATGHARNKPINTYRLSRGLLVSGATGGDEWAPLTSGRLYFDVKAFFRDRSIETDDSLLEGDSNGLSYALEYDNRDFETNPSAGSLQRFAVNHDFGWFNSTSNWTSIELDLRKYLSFGNSDYFRQRVLALNLWTAYAPNWETVLTDDGPVTKGRPPNYMGASLGGFDRLKAYPMYRFSDKAALLYSAELRMIPRWDPKNIKMFRAMDIDWIQLVPFIEVGRVAPTWSLDDFHHDMKWNLGLGFRFMMNKVVFRVDTAANDKVWSMWAMVSHPF